MEGVEVRPADAPRPMTYGIEGYRRRARWLERVLWFALGVLTGAAAVALRAHWGL